MADDEEFADIDWSAVVDPTEQVGGVEITSSGGGKGNDNNAVVINQNPQHCQNENINVVRGTMMPQHQPMEMEMAMTQLPSSSLPVHHHHQQQQQQPPADDGIEALRSQIFLLQNQLHSKDETITDLQNTAASSQYESSHRIKAAEEEAKRKIHLVQEELRRVKMEADKYKGGWVRSKKRVTELEHNNSAGIGGAAAGGQSKTNRVSHDTNQENALSAFGFPTDIETRRVTPSNLFGNNHHHPENNNECAPTTTTTTTTTTKGQQLFESDTATATAVGGSKRKNMEPSPLLLDVESTRRLVSQTIFQYESQNNKNDTVMQRLARHLIMRDEMGCYSLTKMEQEQLLLDVRSNSSSDVKPPHDASTAYSNEREGGAAIMPSGTIHLSMQQSRAKGEETRLHVRSILYQLVDTDGISSDPSGASHKYFSSSGLFFILMTRLNALFDNMETKFDDLMVHTHSITCGSVSSMSVLYIFRVMYDILVLSTRTRDDFRYWLYQSQQPLGSGHEQKKKSNAGASTSVHSRIEGVPSNQIKQPTSNDSKEALWTLSCRATLIERGNEWDPMTMSQPCNTFFGITVALMKGSSYGSNSFDLELKGNMVQMIREQAIRLALTLMSDAPPYRHTESVGRTPYLWKFWFDSLFPTNAMNGADTENDATEQVEDFFSLWEVADGRAGRKRCSRPTAEEATKSNKQKRSNNGTIRAYRRDATAEQQEHLMVKIKCGIIQLLTQLVVSSSSVQQAIYQPTGSESLPLARRVLAAVLDEVDGSIVPLLSSSLSKAQTTTILQYLQLSYSCNQFILALSRSNEGIHMIRYQMRVESDKEGQTHWSHSAISCMALVLNSVLSCAIGMEEEGFTPTWAADLTPYLNGIAEQCLVFFKTIHSFAHNQKRNSSKSKPPTFASLISEQHLVLLACFQKLITREHTVDTVSVSATSCLLWISDERKYDVQVMMEEALYDDL